MAQVAIEDLLKQCSSAYKLVILAAKRAKEVAGGAPALVEMDQNKVTSVALEEIRQGKVAYKKDAAPGKSGKAKGRKTTKRTTKKKVSA